MTALPPLAAPPPPPRTPGPPSPVDAAREAVEHTRRQLFPIRPERWLLFGFVAFLDQCGRGGGSFNFPSGNGGGRGGGDGSEVAELLAWISAHLGLVLAATALALALVVALVALVLWISSRGIFMYVDAVVTGRAEVRRPWREHAEPAGSLFAWRFVLEMGGLFAMLMVIAALLAVVLVGTRGRPPDAALLAIVLLAILLVLPLSLAWVLAHVALRDFVAPLQLHLREPCGGAVRACLGLVRAHPGAFVLYLLLKLVFVVASAMAIVVACCLTCCIAILPVVSQTLFQPLHYFERAWSLCLLRQMGHDLFASFPSAPAATPPRPPVPPPGDAPPVPSLPADPLG